MKVWWDEIIIGHFICALPTGCSCIKAVCVCVLHCSYYNINQTELNLFEQLFDFVHLFEDSLVCFLFKFFLMKKYLLHVICTSFQTKRALNKSSEPRRLSSTQGLMETRQREAKQLLNFYQTCVYHSVS